MVVISSGSKSAMLNFTRIDKAIVYLKTIRIAKVLSFLQVPIYALMGVAIVAYKET